MIRSIKTCLNLLFQTIVLSGLIIWLCAGCQTSVSNATLASQAAPPARTTLAPGDVIKLTFTGAPELNQSQRIRVDGKLSLPLIGEVSAAGKTITGLQAELSELYKAQLKNSDVLVTLESAPTQVVISGAVVKPTKIAFEKPTTVFEAIMEAGGANSYGNLKNVRLIRTVHGVQQSQSLDLSPTLKGAATKPFYVRDGDVIYVPQSLF
jgi:protein involved in polysaccharide export with SLBB domain